MKIRITITADYMDRSVHLSEPKLCDMLRQRTITAMMQTKLLAAGGLVRDHTVEVASFTGIAYVVMRAGAPVASYSDERLAQFHIDHDAHPEQCSIEEVETC